MRLCSFSFRRLYSTSKPLFKRLKLDLSMVAPASIKICVLGCGRKGTPKTVLVDTAITRYLINCGEGTQRLITERRSKAARINHAFFTRMSWDAVSGLLGIALTAKAAGVKKLMVHGHPSISQLMSLTRHFADCDTTDIVVSDILEKPFVDTAFQVKSFRLQKQALNDYEPNMKRSKPETMDDPLSTVYCYYFQPFLSRPKLNKQKCIELGIPPSVLESPIVREWIEGNDVTLDDGRVVTAQEATFPPESSPNFMIIDCPDLDFLNAYLSHTELFETLKSTKSDDKLINGVSLIIHLIPQGMFYSKEYQELVQKLEDASSVTLPNEFDQSRSKVQHLVIDGSDCLPIAYGMYSQSIILNKLYDPQVYPLLYELANLDWKMKREKILSQPIDPFTPVVFAEPQLQYQIRPWNGFNNSQYIRIDEQEVLLDTFDPLYMSREEAESQLERMHASLPSIEAGVPVFKLDQSQIPSTLLSKVRNWSKQEYPQITFLGTASSSPNKYRNISGILMQLSPSDYILLDCGEGTLNQLYTLHGPVEVDNILRNLRLILITHMHADHHGGVFSMALARSKLLEQTSSRTDSNSPLPVLAPPAFLRWTTSFLELFGHQPDVDLYIVPHVYQAPSDVDMDPQWKYASDVPKAEDWCRILNSMNIDVTPVKVPHTGTSWAYVIDGHFANSNSSSSDSSERTDPNSWRIVYSGDTPPCPNLVQAGMNCDLLIHEATMSEEHLDLALRTRHSTSTAAIQIGRDMKAAFTLLNHFSQRYGRLSTLDSFHPDVATSFDFMRIMLQDLCRLPYYIPYYKFAFAKHWSLQQTKTQAYVWRKIRESETIQNSDSKSVAELSNESNLDNLKREAD